MSEYLSKDELLKSYVDKIPEIAKKISEFSIEELNDLHKRAFRVIEEAADLFLHKDFKDILPKLPELWDKLLTADLECKVLYEALTRGLTEEGRAHYELIESIDLNLEAFIVMFPAPGDPDAEQILEKYRSDEYLIDAFEKRLEIIPIMMETIDEVAEACAEEDLE